MYQEKVVKNRDDYEKNMADRVAAVKMLLSSIPNEDATREGLLETPDRVASMYEEIFGGYEMDPHEILSKTFSTCDMYDEEVGDACGNGMILVKDIPFFSHCEHHMVTFFGHVHVAYIPGERVVGLSKIARLVECYARRLQVQERMTNQIAEAIMTELKPKGVMVTIKAEHMCMVMRGVKKPGSNTVTTATAGVFESNSELRMEATGLISL